MKPSLADLYLDDNALETFDWGALYPLRHTLTQLHLDDQKPKMHSLTLSGRAFNTSIQHLYIQDNSLKSVPIGVLDSIGWNSFIPASLNIARNAFCEGFTDCSCCEMAYLVSWAKKITLMERPSGVYTSVTLSCGSQSDLISINREKFHIVPDWFDHCDTAITTVITSSTGIPKSATRISTYAGASNHNSSALCRETKPIEINCSSGRLTIPEPDLSRAEGTVITFRIDRSFGCISKLYNLHTMALELFNVSEQTGIQQHPHEEINVDCISGLPTISSTDPENSHARQLTFRSDFTSECFPKFTEFLNHIHINIVTDDNMYSVATGNAEHELLDPMWRTCGNIVTANCTEGTFVFSHIQYIALLADGVVIRIDQSFDCRSTLVAIHEHILAQEMTVVQPRPPEPLPKSIAVVCSKGHVLVSEGHPRRSKKTIIEYSAKPSKFCRATFQKFMEYLFGL
ncbi:uncharacterized protein LOC129583046 [Paramacrobiotus metropolitanus]|uniref:uncharacterized protein LOC129583046 n=1 Tax=Paramacrobiotus metropolitanus TaxID=2943436 RepID=UPI002445E891|nr:uncharacterized protein LOC129583046 [Paramacrobiotus metropolitanus]